jgi:hypothetical protein
MEWWDNLYLNKVCTLYEYQDPNDAYVMIMQ